MCSGPIQGAKVWSAGYDVREFPQPGRDPLTYDEPLEQAIRAIQRCPAPVIAMLEGGVWGGACELAFVCDILIGTENTSFAITPARLGIPYNLTGILHVLNKIGMSLAREMFCTAQPVKAERAAGSASSITWCPRRNWRILPTPWPPKSPRIPPSASRS